MPNALSLRLLLVALPFCLGVGCGGGGQGQRSSLRFDGKDPIEPAAGTWATWLLPRGDALRPSAVKSSSSELAAELDELLGLQAQRTAQHKALVLYWNGGSVRRWNEECRQLIARRSTNPPRAARALALLSVATCDAMIASFDAKYTFLRARPSHYSSAVEVLGGEPSSPSFVSERAAVSAAAAQVLLHLYPADAAEITGLQQSAELADLISGTHFRSDVEAGRAIGDVVGKLAVERAKNDKSDAPFQGTRRTGDGFWQPTPPAYVQDPLEPGCGAWRTWVLPSGEAIRPPQPPTYSSPEFASQVEEVWHTNQTLTTERLATALFWADGAGTQTPPGHWNEIAVSTALAQGMSEPRFAKVLALLGVAQADAFIACWECKYFYWCVRPITEVRKRFDPNWLPPIATPPFPSFPSGHSTTSGAAATVLASAFPEVASSLLALAADAMNSRLYGGIHFSFDNLTGFEMGAIIGARALNLPQAHD